MERHHKGNIRSSKNSVTLDTHANEVPLSAVSASAIPGGVGPVNGEHASQPEKAFQNVGGISAIAPVSVMDTTRDVCPDNKSVTNKPIATTKPNTTTIPNQTNLLTPGVFAAPVSADESAKPGGNTETKSSAGGAGRRALDLPKHRTTRADKQVKRKNTKSRSNGIVFSALQAQLSEAKGELDAAREMKKELQQEYPLPGPDDQGETELSPIQSLEVKEQRFVVLAPALSGPLGWILSRDGRDATFGENVPARRVWELKSRESTIEDDARPVHSLGHKLYRQRRTISKWKVVTEERFHADWVGMARKLVKGVPFMSTIQRRNYVEYFVAENVALDVIGRMGTRYAATAERDALESSYDIVASSSNVDVRIPGLKDGTVQFIRDYSRAMLGFRDGYNGKIWDFHPATPKNEQPSHPAMSVGFFGSLATMSKRGLDYACYAVTTFLLVTCLACLLAFMCVAPQHLLPVQLTSVRSWGAYARESGARLLRSTRNWFANSGRLYGPGSIRTSRHCPPTPIIVSAPGFAAQTTHSGGGISCVQRGRRRAVSCCVNTFTPNPLSNENRTMLRSPHLISRTWTCIKRRGQLILGLTRSRFSRALTLRPLRRLFTVGTSSLSTYLCMLELIMLCPYFITPDLDTSAQIILLLRRALVLTSCVRANFSFMHICLRMHLIEVMSCVPLCRPCLELMFLILDRCVYLLAPRE